MIMTSNECDLLGNSRVFDHYFRLCYIYSVFKYAVYSSTFESLALVVLAVSVPASAVVVLADSLLILSAFGTNVDVSVSLK